MKKLKQCPFCYPDPDREIIVEDEKAFAIFDKFPVTKGHSLVISKRHCDDYFDLNHEEQAACWNMINELKMVLQKRFQPDGFNIGVNVNEPAGQTIPHVHIHLIPRYNGDVSDPEGGVRGVIPEKRTYRTR